MAPKTPFDDHHPGVPTSAPLIVGPYCGEPGMPTDPGLPDKARHHAKTIGAAAPASAGIPITKSHAVADETTD